VSLLSVTTLALATPPPFDFTGTWTGGATAPGIDHVVTMAATFTSTGPRTFTGSLTFPLPDRAPELWQTCSVRGRSGRRVTLHLACEHPPGESGKATMRAHLDRASNALTGPVTLWQRGNGRHRGTFTLTKSPPEAD
jgi:hypothetical protein